MTVFEFVLGSLATHRLSLLVSHEDGPAWVFRKLRNIPDKKSSLHKGIRCQWCVSQWMGGAVASFYWWTGVLEPMDTILASLAFSSAAICVNQAFTKG